MKKFLMLSLLFVPAIMLGMEEESKEGSVYDHPQIHDYEVGVYGGRSVFTKRDGNIVLSKNLAGINLNENLASLTFEQLIKRFEAIGLDEENESNGNSRKEYQA